MKGRLALSAVILVLGFATVASPFGLAGQATTEPDSESATEVPYGATPPEFVPYSGTDDPYRRFYLKPLEYHGPGRETVLPELPPTIRIGLLAPLERTREARAGRSLKRGIDLALEEANAGGGYSGLPFELVVRNDEALWGSSANTLVELAYEENVWAVIGSIDSTSTHVALRVALKAELPIVNVGSTDPTMTETGIPWLVRLTPDDRQTSYRLARLVFEELGLSRVAVLRSTERHGRMGVPEFRDAARRLGRPLPLEIIYSTGQEDFTPQLEQIAGSGAEAVVLWAGARDSALIVRQMREVGLDQPIFGTDRLVSPEFLELAGPAAEGVRATAWLDPGREDVSWSAFRGRFRERFDSEPDAFAAYGYDAALMLVAAVREAGLNRALIRDRLMSHRSYHGVAGAMRFDENSNNVLPPMVARVEQGRFVFR
jgi:ABC-type branched-subunit amino acid transport system substrate-binding protein